MKRDKSAERDVEPDENVVNGREEGGIPNPEHPDQHTTTGTTRNETFVGRVAGQDVGYAEETGAERRSEASRSDEES